MARLLVVLSVCIVAASAIPRLQHRLPGRIFGGEDAKPAADLQQDRRLSGKIAGGVDALPGDVPWQAQVVVFEGNRYDIYCGGSILNPTWVISSASCPLATVPAGSTLTVMAGLINMDVLYGGEQQQDVAEVTSHPDYDSYSLANNIALMRLQGPLQLTAYVFPIALPSSSYQASGNAQISGFGQTEDNLGVSRSLRKATISLMSDEQCNALVPPSINVIKTMLCAGRTEGGVGACQYDWGGPLVCGSVLCGVFSQGFGCGQPYTPYISTEVSYFVSWITEVTGITQ